MRRFDINVRTVMMTVIITVVMMSILLYAPSPFVVTKPGIAVSTESFITLEHEPQELHSDQSVTDQDSGKVNESDKGQLFLTAVLLETPNIWRSIGAMFKPSNDVNFKADVLGGASLEEYVATVTTMMKGSHQQALEAAYRYLDIEYSIQSQQVKVQQVNHLSSATSPFVAGDHILAAVNQSDEQLPIQSITELSAWLKEQAVDGKIKKTTFIVERDNGQLPIELKDIKLDLQLSEEQMVAKALGVISFVEIKDIVPSDKQYKVTIATDNIGGPSAGLVFALTVIDKLSSGDLTKGKQIAATGTIDAAGKVGVIGGIVQKVYTTSKQGVDVFLVPKGNEKAAKRTLKSIDSEMQIIGVETLEEAIEVIASLQ